MDLIDKKLSEKLKLFDYIDKKYGSNIDESNMRKKKPQVIQEVKIFSKKKIIQIMNYMIIYILILKQIHINLIFILLRQTQLIQI